MAADYVVIDTVAIQNLFAGGGTTAWGQLTTGGKKLVVSSVILEELADAPHDLYRVFTTWMKASGIQAVVFELPDLRRDDGSLKTDAGDKVLRALMDPQNADAQAAMRNAGIPFEGRLRLLTDDAGFLRKVWNATSGFSDNIMKAQGHAVEPYRGTAEFMAERYAVGDLKFRGRYI